MKEENYLTVAEFGLRAKKTPATIYTMTKAGLLKYKMFQEGNRQVKRIPESELEKFEKR